MESGLSTREADPIDPIPQGMETGEYILQDDGSILLGMENQGMVVTVRTAKITARKEKYRTEFSRPIQKGSL
jgi:hypothetical protein